MGVPAFFRWLSRKYPSIVSNCNEDKPKDVNGVTVPVDTTLPNPNGVEFDNLYLDMNGIVHPCTHPEDRPAPKNEAEMMVAIFDALDRLFRIVRPRRLVFMAVDGVAPRAKMNQQRSRRFRAAKEAREKREEIEKIRDELSAQGIPLPPCKKPEDHFDSNCITPGTPFMARLSDCLRYYIHDRVTNDPAWRNLIVILSDANVPGEGEHKIMDFIRRQRSSPGHDPNTHHILCGADADLIMLGLATHEPYFTIIREEFVPNQQRPCELCGQYGHELRQCQGLAKIKSGEYDEVADPVQKEKNYIFIRLTVLREYLERELTIPNLPFPFDFERAIDDWVFMCFFVGNDFLPHLPSLEIREGAIDRLIKLYKACVYKTNGFLTENGIVNLRRVQLIMTELGEVEDEIFRVRQQNEVSRRSKEKERKKRMKAMSMPASLLHDQWGPTPINVRPNAMANARNVAYEMRMQQNYNNNSSNRNDSSNLDAAKKLKSMMSLPGCHGGGASQETDRHGMKRKHEQDDDDDDEEEIVDDVRLWEAGWKERYYQSKFEVSANDVKFRYRVAKAYVEGLCWVLRYYYQGCCDWGWFYPYHYAPFASDFVNLGDLKVVFDSNSKSITPFEQLMSVFPAASRTHVPSPWAELMVDLESSIIDFYPTDFKVDLNGKKFAWQGVALLPFVDARRLSETLVDVYETLTDEEKERNIVGENAMFVSTAHEVYSFFKELYDNPSPDNDWIRMDGVLTKGVSGLVRRDKRATLPESIVKSPLVCCPDLMTNVVVSVEFLDPQFADKFIFPAKKLAGVKEPLPCLKPQNWNDSQESYRPMIGFTRDMPRASLSDAGRRFLRSGLGEYSNAPPPPFQQGQRNRFNNPSRGADRNCYNRTQQGGYNASYDSANQQQQRFNRPPIHYQQMMRHQNEAFNRQQQQQQYQQRIPPDPNQYWQPPQRWSSQQQHQRYGQGNNNQPPRYQQQPSSGRPSAADYF